MNNIDKKRTTWHGKNDKLKEEEPIAIKTLKEIRSAIRWIIKFLYFWKNYEENIEERTNFTQNFTLKFLEFLKNWGLFERFPWVWEIWWNNSRINIALVNIMRDVFIWKLSIIWFRLWFPKIFWWKNRINEIYNFVFEWKSDTEKECVCWLFNDAREKMWILNMKDWSILNMDSNVSPDEILISQINRIMIFARKNLWPYLFFIDIKTLVEENNSLEKLKFWTQEWFLITSNQITKIPDTYSENPEFCTIFGYEPWKNDWRRFDISSNKTELLVTRTIWNKVNVLRFLLLSEKFDSWQDQGWKYVYYMLSGSSFDKPNTSTKKSSSILRNFFSTLSSAGKAI